MPIVLAHLPDATSVTNLRHHSELIRSGKFQKLNRGPQYDLSLVTAPVALIYSTGDPVATESNAKLIQKALPNGAKMHQINDQLFSHIHFFLAKNLKETIHDKIFANMEEEEKLAE